MSHRPNITLYYDVQSPFAYLAFYFLDKSPTFNRTCVITYKPIYASGLMTLNKAVPPWKIENKSVWLETERIDWAKRFDIPMAETLPEGWPMRSTIKVQRMLAALSLSAEEEPQLRGEYVSAIQAIYTAFWVQRKSVHVLEVFGEVLADVMGREIVEETRVRSEGSKIRELLRDNTREAFQDGAFGIPWIVAVNGQGERKSFWGFDRLGMVAEFLGFGTPVLVSEDGIRKPLAWPFHLL